MTEQTNRASLYRKLAAIAGEIETVEKDGRNKDQGYTYATPASVFRALKPLMAKHSIAIVPLQAARQDVDTGRTSRSGTPYILTSVDMSYLILDGESGESITATWSGVAGAYGDDKGNAKAQTIALRTFLIQLFQIPAEDADTDPDNHGEPPVRQPQRREAQPTRPPTPAETNGNSARAALVSKYRQVVTDAREKQIEIAPAKTGDMTDEQLQRAIDEVKRLTNAKVGAIPIGDAAN